MEQQTQTNLEEQQFEQFIDKEIQQDLAEQVAKSKDKIDKNVLNTVPYNPLSGLIGMGTVVPLQLASETLQAQNNLYEQVGDIDNYLVNKLQYSSKFALSQAFSAEQCDAIALAIYQMENNMGFILADMAGIGKGRVNAGILRYAKVNGYIPVFITEKPNLFTAMYRDLTDIGGITPQKISKNNKVEVNAGTPLILNGYKSAGSDKIYDANSGKWIKKSKPCDTSILDSNGNVVIEALDKKLVNEIMETNEFPKQFSYLKGKGKNQVKVNLHFDYIALTYSQLSSKDNTQKADYLRELAQNNKLILCLDECHNASGEKSTTGNFMKELIPMTQGVLFSSATFSKQPQTMHLYASKTNLKTSSLGTEKLIDVISLGGERLIESLASNLVLGGQMIRRERTYDNCNVLYNFMSNEEKEALFNKYDQAVITYHEISKFFSEQDFIQAKQAAMQRFADQQGVELADPRPAKKENLEEWYRVNAGKYQGVTSVGDLSGSQFNFINTLLFALKADFVATQALEQLSTQSPNIKVKDKEEFLSNRKPVISVVNTVSSIYAELGWKIGKSDITKADFSLYIASYLTNMEGEITLKEVTKKKNKKKNIEGELQVRLDDFEDRGKKFLELKEKVENLNLNIPLSPIDYILDILENTPRQAWDKYGDGSITYNVGEVTARQFRLRATNWEKDKNGNFDYRKPILWSLEANTKDQNKSSTFKKFNSGVFDALLINEAGSTGEDAHSSERFLDQRPRVMIIHQVELDVNTEVQKRGRINRTGMVNYPTYIYAISRIPSEIRRLLMLTKKLRKLDANTTANQKQSQKLSTIRDSDNNPIEDIINIHGDEVLDEFLSVPANSEYLIYRPNGGEYNPNGDLEIEGFARKLELALSEKQEVFYNIINELYRQKKEEKGGFEDLETNISDLRCSIKTRFTISKGANTNPFDSSVFIEDDYAYAEDNPYSKEKVEKLVLELSKGKEPEEFYFEFIEDYVKWFNEEHIPNIKNSINAPNYEGLNAEAVEIAKSEYESKVRDAVEAASNEFDDIIDILTYDFDENNYFKNKGKGNIIFKPRRAVLIPAILDECYIENYQIVNYNLAEFVGIRILNTALDKYSPMNIELIFCQISGKSRVSFKPTLKGRMVLTKILSETFNQSRNAISWGMTVERVKDWQVDPNRRDETTKIRLLTGNILSAYGVAMQFIEKEKDKYSPILTFLKFTTSNEKSLRYGIKLNKKKILPDLEPDEVPQYYPLGKIVNELLATKNKFVKGTHINPFSQSVDFVLEYYNGNLKIFILGGLSAGKNYKETYKYFSPIFDKDEIINEARSLGFDTLNCQHEISSGSKNMNPYARRIKIYLDENNKDRVVQLMEFIYSLDPITISITDIEDEFLIYQRKDVEKVGEELLEEEGEFGYNTLIPYKIMEEAIQKSPKYFKYVESPDYPKNGTAYFNKRLRANEAVQLQLIPLDSSLKDMVYDTFSMITDDIEKQKLKDAIFKAIDEGKSDREIADIVIFALRAKVYSIQSIFGYAAKSKEFIGQVFRRFKNKEFELPQVSILKEEEEKEEKELKPLNLENSENYIIILYDAINKK